MSNLKAIEEKLGVKFNDPKLLGRALVHRSYLNEALGKELESNERLEFLGDAILSFVISRWLFADFPQYPEGVLTTLRSSIVRTTALARIAREIGIGEYLLMSKGEKESGGQENPSILADTMEAIIGAIYLDQGVKTIDRFIKTKFADLVTQVSQSGNIKDAKSLFQEKAQANTKFTPVYKTLHETGPDHAKTFTVGVFLKDELIAQGQGKSKQVAEEKAAREALKKIQS